MQKPFTTQHEFFFTSADLKHPSFHGLDGAEAGLDASTIGRFRQQLVELGLCDILLGDEAALYADAAYYSQATREKLDKTSA